jgi:hypothetical protein
MRNAVGEDGLTHTAPSLELNADRCVSPPR